MGEFRYHQPELYRWARSDNLLTDYIGGHSPISSDGVTLNSAQRIRPP